MTVNPDTTFTRRGLLIAAAAVPVAMALPSFGPDPEALEIERIVAAKRNGLAAK